MHERPFLSRRRIAVTFIAALLAWIHVGYAGDDATAGAASQSKKKAELQRTQADISDIQTVLKTLKRVRQEFARAQEAFDRSVAATPVESKKSEMEKALADARDAVDAIKRMPDTDSLSPSSGEFQKLLQSLRILGSSARRSGFFGNDPFPSPRFGQDELDARAAYENCVDEGKKKLRDQLTPLGKSRAVLARFVFNREDEDLTKKAIAKDLDDIWTALSTLAVDAIIDEMTETTKTQSEAMKAALSALDREISDREARLEKLGERSARLEDEVTQDLVSTDAKNKTLLTWATIALIVVLLLMFLSLRLFSDPIKEQIIENRTLIELVSMAFLLLTIILLGTAGKLKEEAIGTLLGTIAGYIFGRHPFTGSDKNNSK